MKILSLFDGISCGMVALERAGIKVERYTAYEIDEDAIKISRANYPQVEHKGDVFKAEYNAGEYDLLIGGSPCTYWSIATAGNGTREKTSCGLGWDLFSQYVRALHEAKPRYFLYENNESMSDDIKNEITKALGVIPIMIDSADFSAQKRKRYYWTNINFKKEWEKSPVLFSDIEDKTGAKITRSIEKYKKTYRWNKEGNLISWDTSGKGYYSQASRARTTKQKFNTVCANRAESKSNVWLGNDTIRLITIKELERLQTLPDDYTAIIKNKEARGKAIGNGWTVEVIAHILQGLK
jgi:site-specific DNA-cytosine methylase